MPLVRSSASAKAPVRPGTRVVSSQAEPAQESSRASARQVLAKLFQNGRSQAVRLPKEFRFDGKEVQISRQGEGVLLTPVDRRTREQRWNDFLAMLAEYRDLDPMPGGREQGVLEPEEIFPEDW